MTREEIIAEILRVAAQRLLGHSKIDTTMAIYTHLREKKQKESIDKLVSHVQAQLDKKTDNNSDNKSM